MYCGGGQDGTGDMEFEDHEGLERWLKSQSHEVCVAIAARAALRALRGIFADRFWKGDEPARNAQERLALISHRCCAIACTATVFPGDELQAFAATAAKAAFKASSRVKKFSAKTVKARNVAYEAEVADNAGNAACFASHCYAHPLEAAHAAASAVAFSDEFELAGMDAGLPVGMILQQPLWYDSAYSEALLPSDLGSPIYDRDPRFDFFRRWYDSMVRGAPLDWELQRRVALIPQETWEAGADAVAEAIAEIEKAWKAEQQGVEPRRPEFEPRQVTHLFENKIFVSAGMSSLSSTIRQEFERFRAETGLNETPEMFAPLEALPHRLDRISEILTMLERSDATEQALREEIGRLNAQVAELEKELAKAKADCEALQKSSWAKIAKVTIAGTGLFGSLVTALWVVSGDEVGAKQRLENLQEYREAWDSLFGNTQPPSAP